MDIADKIEGGRNCEPFNPRRWLKHEAKLFQNTVNRVGYWGLCEAKDNLAVAADNGLRFYGNEFSEIHGWVHREIELITQLEREAPHDEHRNYNVLHAKIIGRLRMDISRLLKDSQPQDTQGIGSVASSTAHNHFRHFRPLMNNVPPYWRNCPAVGVNPSPLQTSRGYYTLD